MLNAPKARIAAFYARGLLDYLHQRGLNPYTLLPPQHVAELDHAPPQSEVSLLHWVALLEAATVALDDATLPAEAGASLNLTHLGVLGQVLIQCQDLREVHQQLARYIRLLGQIGQPVLESHGQRAHLLWQWPYPSAAPMGVAQFMLAARATFSRWLTGRSDLVFDAFFHFPEPAHTHIHTNAHQRIFGGRLHYQQPSSKLVFDEAALNLPVAIADEGIRLQVEARAQSRMAALLQEPALIQRLKSVLRQGLPQGQATVSYAAHALGLTARSLQRHLQAEGLAFQAVLDEVRQSQAEQWLAEGRANLSQIAFLLGYRDQTAFQAAFKRWTGLPPAAWRRVRG